MSQSFYELGFSCIITVYAIQLFYPMLHFIRYTYVSETITFIINEDTVLQNNSYWK